MSLVRHCCEEVLQWLTWCSRLQVKHSSAVFAVESNAYLPVVHLDCVDQEINFVESGRRLCDIVVAGSETCLSAALGVGVPGLTAGRLAAKSDVDDLLALAMVRKRMTMELTIFICFHVLRMSQF